MDVNHFFSVFVERLWKRNKNSSVNAKRKEPTDRILQSPSLKRIYPLKTLSPYDCAVPVKGIQTATQNPITQFTSGQKQRAERRSGKYFPSPAYISRLFFNVFCFPSPHEFRTRSSRARFLARTSVRNERPPRRSNPRSSPETPETKDDTLGRKLGDGSLVRIFFSDRDFDTLFWAKRKMVV